MRLRRAFCLTLALLCLCTAWPRPVRAAAAQRMALLRQAEDFLAGELEKARVPAAAWAFADAGGVQLSGGRGGAGADTPFLIGSLSKSITARAVLQLAAAGTLSLNDPVTRYLPWLAEATPAAQNVTLNQLLHHSAGIATGESTARLRFGGEAGRFAYSNAGYELLGRVVEEATGRPYAEVIEQDVFAPLGMAHSSASIAGAEGLQSGHVGFFGTLLPQTPRQPQAGAFIGAASGMLAASAGDLGLYLADILARQAWPGLGGDAQPMGNAPTSTGIFAEAPGAYGYGWVQKEVAGQSLYFHTGQLPGYTALMALLPDTGVAMVVLYAAGDAAVGTPMMNSISEGALDVLLERDPVAQWEHTWLLQHAVIDIGCLLALVLAAVPLLTDRFWRRGVLQGGFGAGGALGLVVLHGLLPAGLLCVPLLLRTPYAAAIEYAPDIALTLVLVVALLLAGGLSRGLRLPRLLRQAKSIQQPAAKPPVSRRW